MTNEEKAEAIRTAAAALVKKLRECEPVIASAFTMMKVHGSNYVGPTYGEELKALEKVLAEEGTT